MKNRETSHDDYAEDEAERRFQGTLRAALVTPPTPLSERREHTPKLKQRKGKPAKASPSGVSAAREPRER